MPRCNSSLLTVKSCTSEMCLCIIIHLHCLKNNKTKSGWAVSPNHLLCEGEKIVLLQQTHQTGNLGSVSVSFTVDFLSNINQASFEPHTLLKSI